MNNNQRIVLKRKADRFRVALKRSWNNGSHRNKINNRPLDADTIRFRALWDRKGNLAYSIIKDGREFLIYHSAQGRTDQYDIVVDGDLIRTTRKELILKIIDDYSI